MGDASAASLIVVAFLSRHVWVLAAGLALRRADDPAPFGYRAASAGAVIGVPACTAQVTYRLIIGP
jgi:hypothetical protein